MELFLEYRTLFLNAAVILMFAIAVWKGGGPERACATTLLAMLVVDRVYHAMTGPSVGYAVIDPWHLLIDTGGLVAFVAIALQANRFYPLVLAAAQLVAFTAHIVRMTVEPVSSLSYFLLYTMPFWFQLLILAGGLARHILRKGRMGVYRDWRLPTDPTHRASYS